MRFKCPQSGIVPSVLELTVPLRLDIPTPMRDGVLLAADLYLPNGASKFSTLVCRTPYNKQMESYVEWAMEFVSHGYAVVMQDCRGRFASEGAWTPYVDEASDGHDTVEWVGAQDWCDGNVGMFGISYAGFTQMLASLGGSRYLKAILPTACQEDNFGHIWVDGVLQLQNAVNFFQIGRRTMNTATADRLNLDSAYRTLPLSMALDGIAECPPFQEFLRHPTLDEYWRSYSLKGRYASVRPSVCLLTGWYDNLIHEQFKIFNGLREAAQGPDELERVRIVVGPWTHFSVGERVVGELDFGEHAQVSVTDLHLEWFDERFGRSGESSTVGKTLTELEVAPIRIFVMGANVWREEREWPLARTQWTPFYLDSDGSANSVRGDGRLLRQASELSEVTSDEFDYDPLNPVPTVGGQSMFLSNTGPRLRNSIEDRADVLVYSTDPLSADIEVTGPIEVVLFAATDGADTDFTATLVDVRPNGDTYIISEGIVRARYRDSVTTPSPLYSSAAHCYRVNIWETSCVFPSGHRIRLEISSSNFPRYDRNLNTGNAIGLDDRYRTAHQTVYHDQLRLSRLVLPVIPNDPLCASTGDVPSSGGFTALGLST